MTQHITAVLIKIKLFSIIIIMIGGKTRQKSRKSLQKTQGTHFKG